MGNIAIRGVVLEKLCLCVPRVLHALFRIDILLAAIDTADEAKLEGVYATGQDIQRIGARVHKIKFRENTDRAAALRVDRACKL